MSTAQENQKSNCRLAQYYHNFHHSDEGLAKRIFLKEPKINYKLSTEKDSELNGCTALHFAAKYNSICDIEFLLSRGADPMIKNRYGFTPLHFAVKENCKRIDGFHKIKSSCKSLLSAQMRSGNLENPSDRNGLSHFHVACMADDAEAIELFLKSGVSVDEAINMDSPYFPGFAPLHLVARYCTLQAMKLLLKYGANMQLKKAEEMTCLYKLGAEINQVLLQNSDLSNNAGITSGFTLLDFASNSVQMVELLLQHGAEILVKDPGVVNRTTPYFLQEFVSSLSHDNNVFKRLKQEIGLTMLHVACSRKDVDLIQTLVASGADVNAQINVKSRLWPGYTPLHIVIDKFRNNRNLNPVVRLLLDNGADITLVTSAARESALHLAYEKTTDSNFASDRYFCVRMILRAHKDFTVNPTRFDGLSHFHVACDIGDTITVKQFLNHGADVNQSTDFFERSHGLAGRTPLLFAAASNDPIPQLELVDLLLNYGADVDAEDINGNTSLHYMAQFIQKREDVILRIVKSEANVNSRNIRGQTPLEVFIKSPYSVTVDDINFFLKLGCLLNAFNSVTDEGLLAIALTSISCEDLVHLIESSMMNFPHLIQMDEIGRTVIHNIFSKTNYLFEHKLVSPGSQYTTLIKELEKFDYDVDDQDKLGRTPLHLAVLFRNTEAISALLMAGADVNVTDATGKTAFSYSFQSCTRCLEKDEKNHNQYDHFNIFSIFVIHMKKLLVCGLNVNQTNKNLMFEASTKFNSKDMSVKKLFEDQINKMRNLKIPQSNLTLENFLSETDAVFAYSTLPQIDRDAVDEFFKNKVWDSCTKYNHPASILFLQYRKAVKRFKKIELTKSAQSALNILVGFHMPDLCSIAILKFLTNCELNRMIVAAT